VIGLRRRGNDLFGAAWRIISRAPGSSSRDQRVVDHDDLLPLKHLSNRIELDFDLGVPRGLRWDMNTCVPRSGCGSAACSELQARFARQSPAPSRWTSRERRRRRRRPPRDARAPARGRGRGARVSTERPKIVLSGREKYTSSKMQRLWGLRRERRQLVDLGGEPLNPQEFGRARAHAPAWRR